MAHRARMSVVVVVALIACVSLWATPAATQTAVPRTSWGDPDISGIFTTDAEQPVPFERPEEFAERRLLTEEKLARRAGQADARIRDKQGGPQRRGGVVGNPGALVRGGKRGVRSHLLRGRPGRWARTGVDG